MATFMRCKFLLLTSAIFLFVVAQEPEYELKVLHTNDFHAAFEEEDSHAGVARMIQFVQSERTPTTIYLNGGNMFAGSLLFTLHKEEIVVKFANMLQFDAIVLGYEEFFWGETSLVNYCKGVNSTILCANCNFGSNLKSTIKSSVVLTKESKKIGIVGYMEKYFDTVVPSGIDVRITDEITSIQNEVDKLKKDGVDIIIALGHGYDDTNKKVARQVVGLDAVVTGRDTSFIYTGQPPIALKPVGPYPIIVKQGDKEIPLVHTIEGSKFVGKLELTYNLTTLELLRYSGNPEYMAESIPNDANALVILQEYVKKLGEKMGAKVGKTTLELSNENCTKQECNFGNVMADAYVYHKLSEYDHSKYWTDTAIGMFMGILLSNKIDPKGTLETITYGDILQALPANHKPMSVTLNGTGLKQVIEHSVYYLEERSGRFLQYSGVHVTYDFSKPPYHRISSLKVRCAKCETPKYKEVVDKQKYRIIVSEPLGKGALGYSTLENAMKVQQESLSDVECLQQYLKEHGAVTTGLEQRIIIKGAKLQRSEVNKSRRPAISMIFVIILLYVFS